MGLFFYHEDYLFFGKGNYNPATGKYIELENDESNGVPYEERRHEVEEKKC